MSIFKPVKQADGYLAPTFEGVPTVEELEANNAARSEDSQRRINGDICRLQDEKPDLQDLIRRHAEALEEIRRLKRSLRATGGALVDAALVSQRIGQQNEYRAGQIRKANARHKESNAAWVKVYQWLESNKETAMQMTNDNAALSVPGDFVGIDKHAGRPLTLAVVSKAIGEWKRGRWIKPTE